MDRRMSVMQRRSRLVNNNEEEEEENVERSNSNRSEHRWYIST